MITQYLCSACGAEVSSEGTEAFDHMVNKHGRDPDPDVPPGEDAPYLIPVDSNPTLDEEGVPT